MVQNITYSKIKILLISLLADLKMDDLLALPSTEIVVTMSCSGNRRKEQNLVKRGVGFDWGAGAVL